MPPSRLAFRGVGQRFPDGTVALAGAGLLEKLVPIVQQAQIDYLAGPGRDHRLIVDLVERYDTGWVYSADYAIGKMRETFVGNGPDQTLGNFDMARVGRMLEVVTRSSPPSASRHGRG